MQLIQIHLKLAIHPSSENNFLPFSYSLTLETYLFIHLNYSCICLLINSSIHPFSQQSNNQSVGQWMNESINQAVGQWMNQWINQSVGQWMNEWINQSINQSISWSMNESINQSVGQWMNESINQTVNEWMNESINQSINRSMNQWINQSINQSINWSMNEGINKSINNLIIYPSLSFLYLYGSHLFADHANHMLCLSTTIYLLSVFFIYLPTSQYFNQSTVCIKKEWYSQKIFFINIKFVKKV